MIEWEKFHTMYSKLNMKIYKYTTVSILLLKLTLIHLCSGIRMPCFLKKKKKKDIDVNRQLKKKKIEMANTIQKMTNLTSYLKKN